MSVEYCAGLSKSDALFDGNQAGGRVIQLAKKKKLTKKDLMDVIDILARPWHKQANDIPAPARVSVEERGGPRDWKVPSLIFIRTARIVVKNIM